MIKKIIFTAFFCFLGLASIADDSLVWPLDIEVSQSSSFAEFRGFRFHAGIDLRTQRTTGFPVRAIEDGFVSRIKVQYRGYGYALYIDHPKLKKRVVYGHLQDYAGEPGEYVKKKLATLGQRFGVDDFFTADKFPVKKGQVVAFSGESGSGPAHLHFELRSLADEPMAPSILGYRPKDKILPSFHRFYIDPFSYPCEINGSFLPFDCTIKKSNVKNHFLSGPITVTGRVGLQVGISDTNGVGNVYGVEKVGLKKNGATLFERKFHQYAYDQNSQCWFVYDYIKSNRKNTGYVVNLFKLPGETLPISSGFKNWSGIIDGNEKDNPIQIEINAEDFGANEIKINGAVKFEKVEYQESISAEEIKDFIFDGVINNPYCVVATGKVSGSRSFPFRRGKVECLDKAGGSEWLPCIVSGKTIEIAFPVQEQWQNGAWVGQKRVLPVTLLVKAQGRKVFSEENGIAEFGSNAVLFPVFARFYRTNLTPTPGGSAKSGFLKPFSPVWTLEPEGVVFADDVAIKIKPENYSGNFQKLGIYEVSNSGKYSHVGEKVVSGWLVADTRLGGSWTVLEDNVAPVVTYKSKGRDYHLGNVWIFKVRDLGEGVDYLSARAICAGKSFEVYSDPDKAEIYVVRPIVKGKYNLELSLKDNAGNLVTIRKELN